MSAPGSTSQAAPRFSVVVPVYNVRDYLRECLDSILAQSFRDLEVIAVDDASPDDSGAILAAVAAGDPRVRVLHLARNVGLGQARNAGVDIAAGSYLVFVDGDDTLTPGALEAIAARLAGTGEPEVLVFDFARTDGAGQLDPDGGVGPIAAAGPDVFALALHPELLRLLFVVWNKVYRLDWVRANGFRFPQGFYEDAPWTYPILLSAPRITVLNRVCYHYRQGRSGNILTSRSRQHFDAFDQYALVFAHLDAHPELEPWRELMFERMWRHFVTILSRADRLPPNSRKEFFERAAAAYHRFRPAGYAPPRGRRGLWAGTFARGQYAMFRAAQVLFGAREAVAARRRSASRVGVLARRALGRLYYQLQRRVPVEQDLVAYAAYWYRGYACSPAAIYQKARELAPHLRGVWIVRAEDIDSVPVGVDVVVPDTAAYFRLMARARYFVNNVNFPHIIEKRPGTVHVQTQHGTPLKTMGLALREHPVAAAGMDFERLLEHVARWDYLTSSNTHSSAVWQRCYPGNYELLEVGLPRNDRLVLATAADTAAARRTLGIDPGQTVVLYAPTYRDWRPGSFDPSLDLRRLCERLGTGFTVLVRAHYFFTDALSPSDGPPDSAALRDVSRHPVVEELMLATDVLLTDYSSIMFDYANLGRPIVILADDWDEYVRVRGVCFDLLAAPPGIVVRTPDGVADVLLSGQYRGPEAEDARQRFAARFCEFDDGHAAEQVVRRVFLGEPAHAGRYGEPSSTGPAGGGA